MKAKGLENQQKIVQSAADLFYQKGYNQTSFTEIANASGLPRGNFYYYFKTKDDILKAVVDARVEAIRGMIEQLQTLDKPPKQRLNLLLDLVLNEADDIVDHGCPLGTLSAELGKDQRLLQEKTLEMFDLLVSWVVDAFQALGCDEPYELGLHIMGRLQGISVMTHLYQNKPFLETEIQALKAWVDQL